MNDCHWAHVFAAAEDAHGMKASTSVLLYDERNQLRVLGEFDSFVTVERELTGNYQAPHNGVDTLFANRIVRRERREVLRGEPRTADRSSWIPPVQSPMFPSADWRRSTRGTGRRHCHWRSGCRPGRSRHTRR